MAEKFIVIILLLPVIAFCIYGIAYPEECVLLGNKWKYKNTDLEPSEISISYMKFSSIFGLVITGLFIILILFR